MNIMDLKIGDVGMAGRVRYRVVRDDQCVVPRLGRVIVRIATDQFGQTHKFIRGIEVERQSPQEREHP